MVRERDPLSLSVNVLVISSTVATANIFTVEIKFNHSLPHSLTHSLSLSLSVCLSVFLSLSVCLSVCLSSLLF